MKNNYSELFNQFIAARGIENSDVYSDTLMRDFFDWIKERKTIGNKYLSHISDFGLFRDSSCFAEVNKGVDDSVTLPCHTKLVSPYIDKSIIDNPERIVDGKFYIDKKHVLSIVSTKDIKLRVISNGEIMTYMTQNPYNSDMLDGWDVLHNSGRNDIIVGVYGNTYDCDRQEKIENLLLFKKKLNHVREFDYTFCDEYFYAIGSSSRRPKLRFR